VLAPSTHSTPSVISKHTSHHEKENIEPTEEELLYFYDPQKEINRYRELKEEELKNKLAAAAEKRNFLKLMEEAKFKMSKSDFNKLEQDYYDLNSA
jgi:cytochrome c553